MTQTVTQLLHQWQGGDEQALKALMPLTLEELRKCAKGLLARKPAAALQPTELIHEAYLRLVELDQMRWESRVQFFALASQVMRNILVDQARAAIAQKRGGDAFPVTLDEKVLPLAPSNEALVALDQALIELQAHDARKAKVVALRYFGGLSGSEIAQFLNIDERTVKRDWQFAKAWLYQKLKPEA